MGGGGHGSPPKARDHGGGGGKGRKGGDGGKKGSGSGSGSSGKQRGGSEGSAGGWTRLEAVSKAGGWREGSSGSGSGGGGGLLDGGSACGLGSEEAGEPLAAVGAAKFLASSVQAGVLALGASSGKQASGASAASNQGSGGGIPKGALIAAIQAQLGGKGLGGEEAARPRRSSRASGERSGMDLGGSSGAPTPAPPSFGEGWLGKEREREAALPLSKSGSRTSLTGSSPDVSLDASESGLRCHPKCLYGICTYHPDDYDVENDGVEIEDLDDADEESLCSDDRPDDSMEMQAPSLGTPSEPPLVDSVMRDSLLPPPSAECSRMPSPQGGSFTTPMVRAQGVRFNATTSPKPSIGHQGLPSAAGLAGPSASTPGARQNAANSPGLFWSAEGLPTPSPLDKNAFKNSERPPNPGNASRHQGNAWVKPAVVPFDFIEAKESICKDSNILMMDDSLVQDSISQLGMSLVGKIIGRPLPYTFLCSELNRRWSHFGKFHTMMITDDCFICSFDSTAARDGVVVGGPWTIAGCLIGLDRWKPEFDPTSLRGFSSPIWVRLPNLPLSCWDKKNIGRFATMVGEPLWLDANTDNKTRCSFARFCVRHDLSTPLPQGVWVEALGTRFFQRFEYEGISAFCFKCGRLGHKESSCPGTVPPRTPAATPPTSTATGANAAGAAPSAPIIGTNLSASSSEAFVEMENKGHGPWNLVVNKKKLHAAKVAALAKAKRAAVPKRQDRRDEEPLGNSSRTGGKIVESPAPERPRPTAKSPLHAKPSGPVETALLKTPDTGDGPVIDSELAKVQTPTTSEPLSMVVLGASPHFH